MLKKPRKKYKSAMGLRDSKYSCKGNYKRDVAFDIEMFLRSSATTHGYGFGGGSWCKTVGKSINRNFDSHILTLTHSYSSKQIDSLEKIPLN